MDLTAPALPQSWYKGEGFTEIVEQVKQFWGGIVAKAADLAKAFSNWAIEQLKKVNIFGVNLGSWFEEDPVGAAAGGAAVGLGTLVVVSTGALGAIGRGLFGGVKWLWKGAKSGIQKLGAGKIIRWGVGAVQRIWNFNWNISDTQIRKQQQQMFEGLAGQLGEAMGSIAGTALCGFALGRVALGAQTRQPQLNPEMIAKLNELKLNDFSDESELWEEAVENLKSFISSGQRTLINAAVLEGFLNVRKLIKGASRGLNIRAIAPGIAGQIENWGAEGQKPWSFASAQEEFVESLPEGVIKNFTEEFLEGFQDQCAESTILVSYAM